MLSLTRLGVNDGMSDGIRTSVEVERPARVVSSKCGFMWVSKSEWIRAIRTEVRF